MTCIAGFFAPLTDEGGFKEDYMEGQGTMKMNNRGNIRCSLQVKAQGRQHIEHWRGGEAKPVLRFADPPGFRYAKLGKETKESVDEAPERYINRCWRAPSWYTPSNPPAATAATRMIG